MEVLTTEIKGVLIIKPTIYTDHRGQFMETFNQKEIESIIERKIEFKQDNLSVSKKNVFRGLHYQSPPFAQAKLVKVTKGQALDFIVDIRKKSLTYGKLITIELSSENRNMVFVPEGMAHGFMALENDVHFSYKCSEYYSPKHEGCINYDSITGIDLDSDKMILSEKDADSQNIQSFNSPF